MWGIIGNPKNAKNIYIIAQFESPKHLHQITFETLKQIQQTTLWNYSFLWKIIKPKVALKCCHFWVSAHPKSNPSCQKVAQMAKNITQSGHPGKNRKSLLTGRPTKRLAYPDRFPKKWAGLLKIIKFLLVSTKLFDIFRKGCAISSYISTFKLT